jgi:hypothetical protein
MFILKSAETIAKAAERAKAVHPKVSVKRVGEYAVTGHAGALYTVRCERRNGFKTVDCSCPAGTFGSPCYHAAAAIAQHVYFLTAQASADNDLADLYEPDILPRCC